MCVVCFWLIEDDEDDDDDVIDYFDVDDPTTSISVGEKIVAPSPPDGPSPRHA